MGKNRDFSYGAPQWVANKAKNAWGTGYQGKAHRGAVSHHLIPVGMAVIRMWEGDGCW